MGMILNKQDELNDELSRRINADLRAKLDQKAKLPDEDEDFGVFVV